MAIQEPSLKSLLLLIAFNGTKLGIGTGFVMETASGHVLITNRHNVTGRHQETNQPISKTGGIPNEIYINHNKRDELGTWIPKKELLYRDEQPLWIEHPILGAKADFVALPLTDFNDVDFYPYKITTTAPLIQISPAEIISVIGFPFGLTAGGSLAIWATGFIASEPDINFQDLPVFLIDCRTRQGQSGSAVIAHRNGAFNTANGIIVSNGPTSEFLGIYSGRVNAESDLGFVWKASAIDTLLKSI